MRQRVRRAINDLVEQPRPSISEQLVGFDDERELRRLRLDTWRVVYAITDKDAVIDVVAVRKRPPYDYGDLAALLRDMG